MREDLRGVKGDKEKEKIHYMNISNNKNKKMTFMTKFPTKHQSNKEQDIVKCKY